jgi:hypothetical protein
MKKENIRQFKMVSGEELVCEVVDWETDDDFSILVKNLFKIHLVEDHQSNTRYYSLRPYLCLQTGEDLLQTINEAHIMASALPSETLLTQYKTTIRIERMTSVEIEEELKKRIDNLKEFLDEDDIEEMLDEETHTGNVVQFPPKDKLH